MMTASTTSRALVTTAHGGPEVVQLQQRAVPVPGPGQVRVRIHNAAFNHLDLWVRNGIPAGHWPVPIVPCADGAGVIDALGPGLHDTTAKHLQLGAPVVLYPVATDSLDIASLRGTPEIGRSFGLLGENMDGCARDHLLIDAHNVVPKPAALSFAEAAAMPTTFITAWHMLKARAQLQAGETVVVHGARSGMGSAGVQVARVLGARVIATVRRPEDVAPALALGADQVVRTDDPGWSRAIKKATGGVEVVFEHVGGAIFSDSIGCLRRGGRLVTCGATAGHEVQINLRKLFFHSISLLGSTMGSRADLLDVLRLAEQNKLKATIGARRPLAEGAAAMDLLQARSVFGKVVLDVA